MGHDCGHCSFKFSLFWQPFSTDCVKTQSENPFPSCEKGRLLKKSTMFSLLWKFIFLIFLVLPASLVLIGNGESLSLAWFTVYVVNTTGHWLYNSLMSYDVLGIWNDLAFGEVQTAWMKLLESYLRSQKCFTFMSLCFLTVASFSPFF